MTEVTPTSDGTLAFDLDAAYAHLRAADPMVGRLIDRFGPYSPRRRMEPYAALIRSIFYQQLAGKAAAAILARFQALYGGMPTPEQLLATTDETLRSVGLSRQKMGYLRDLADRVADGRLDLPHVESLSDDEIMSELTAVKGIGEWSAHMFLLFQLGRADVMPTGDLGVRKGMKVVYGLADVPTPAEAAKIGEPWKPYRSVGSWYMWRAAETALPDW